MGRGGDMGTDCKHWWNVRAKNLWDHLQTTWKPEAQNCSWLVWVIAPTLNVIQTLPFDLGEAFFKETLERPCGTARCVASYAIEAYLPRWVTWRCTGLEETPTQLNGTFAGIFLLGTGAAFAKIYVHKGKPTFNSSQWNFLFPYHPLSAETSRSHQPGPGLVILPWKFPE